MRKPMNPAWQRRRFLGHTLGLGAVALTPVMAQPASTPPARAVANVRECGAAGDGAKLDTRALQAAIDDCSRAGGGTVFFPAGAYLTGTLVLRNHVTLHLDAGAVLLGSTNLADYPPHVPAVRSYTDHYTERSLIYAEGAQNIGLTGRGAINGQGKSFQGPYKVRPYLIRMIACQDVAIRDLGLKDSPMWVQHYLACDGVQIDGLRIDSRCNANNDGLDIDGCQRVRIANCDISSGDDAIVLKSTLDRPCKSVAITNCLLSSACNAFKLGTESNGGFEDIVLSNCVMYDTGLAGIALELVDGGRLERVAISHVTMHRVNGAIFVRLGNRARPFKEGMAKPGQGSLRQVSISHVRAWGANRIGCSITGLPGAPVEDVTLSDIRITFAGGVTNEQSTKAVEEKESAYPEYSMFGMLPAYGFYCRHAKALRLSNVRLDLAQPDGRSALVCEDVQDLDVSGWRAALGPKAAPLLRLTDVRDALLHGCCCPDGAAAFVRVEGRLTQRIRLLANDWTGAAKEFELAAGAPESAVVSLGR